MRSELALAALASAAVPGMKPVTVAGIRPGDSDRELEIQRAVVHDATGRAWVVHAPLTPVAGARLQRHDELVRQLPRHVPFKVPAAVGYASVGSDGAAVVYPFIEGSPLDLGRLPAGPGLASAVGRGIAAIHNIPRAVFEAQDVPVFDAQGVRQRAIAEVDRAAETGRVPTGLLARWEEAFESAPLWQFATTPVHGSFRGSSLLVAFSDDRDAGSGRIVAVLNWDEACVGDPASDLAELLVQASPAAWESVLDSYSLARAQRPDPYLHARARLASELRSLRGLARAVEEDREDAVRRTVESLRRMDRLTEDDDSLVPAAARQRGGSVAPLPADEGYGPDDAGTTYADFEEEETGWETELVETSGDATDDASRPVMDEDTAANHPADGAASGPDEREKVEGPDAGDDLTVEVPVLGGPHAGHEAGTDDNRTHNPTDDELTEALGDELSEDLAGPGAPDDEVSPDDELTAGADSESDTPETDSRGSDTPESDTAASVTPDDEAAGDDETAGPGDRELSELDDEERLHELYGMPEAGPDLDGPGSRPGPG